MLVCEYITCVRESRFSCFLFIRFFLYGIMEIAKCLKDFNLKIYYYHFIRTPQHPGKLTQTNSILKRNNCFYQFFQLTYEIYTCEQHTYTYYIHLQNNNK